MPLVSVRDSTQDKRKGGGGRDAARFSRPVCSWGRRCVRHAIVFSGRGELEWERGRPLAAGALLALWVQEMAIRGRAPAIKR